MIQTIILDGPLGRGQLKTIVDEVRATISQVRCGSALAGLVGRRFMDRVLTAVHKALEAGESALAHLDGIAEQSVFSAADCHIALGLDLIRQSIDERTRQPPSGAAH